MAKRKPDPKATKTLLRASWSGAAESFDRAWSVIIEEMLVLYFPPVEADSDEAMLEWSGVALKAYLADLSEFSTDVLQQAWQRVRRTHPRMSWPSIHVLRAACQEEAALAVPSRASKAVEGKFNRFDADADACMRTDFGRRAISEGWGWDLFCHVRDTGEVPSDPRILSRLKHAQARASQAMAGVSEANPMYATLLGLHHAIIRKNDWLAAKYLGAAPQEHAA